MQQKISQLMQLDNDIFRVTFSDSLPMTSSLISMCKVGGIPLQLHHIHTPLPVFSWLTVCSTSGC